MQAYAQNIKKLKAVQRAVDESILTSLVSPDGLILDVNEKFCEISKYQKEELVGRPHSIINSGYHSNEFFSRMRKKIAAGNTWRGEMRCMAKDGSLFWTETTIVPMTDENGHIESYLTLRILITDRKETEQSLKRSQDHSKGLLDAVESSYEELQMIDIITGASLKGATYNEIIQIAIDTLSRYTGSNRSRYYSYCDLENCLFLEVAEKSDRIVKSLEKSLGKPLSNLIPSIQKGSYFHQAISGKEIVIIAGKTYINKVLREHTSDKEQKALAPWARRLANIKSFIIIPLLRAHAVTGVITLASEKVLAQEEKEKLKRFATNLSTILSKLRAEEEIVRQKKFTETILNNLPADIAVFDKQHRYLFVNTTGVKNEEMRQWIIGKDDFDYCKFRGLDLQMAEGRRATFEKAIASGQTFEWVDEYPDGPDNKKYLMRRLYPYYEEGHLKYVFGYGIDVTTLKKAETQKDEYIRQLEQMTFTTSHMLRLPVANLIGMRTLLETERLSQEDLKKVARYMKESLEKLNSYTRELTRNMEAFQKKLITES